MKKRIIGIALTFALLLGAMPVSARAAANGLTPEVAGVYKSLIEENVEVRGETNATDSSQPSAVGLARSSLVDFDGDGCPELYLLYVDQPRDENNNIMTKYQEEVWKYVGNNTANQIFSEEKEIYYTFQRNACETYIQLLAGSGKVFRVRYEELETGSLRSGNSIDLTVSQLKDGKFTDVLMVTESMTPSENMESSIYDCYVNGNLVDEHEAEMTEDDAFSYIRENRSPNVQRYYDTYMQSKKNAVIHSSDLDRCVKWQSSNALDELRRSVYTSPNLIDESTLVAAIKSALGSKLSGSITGVYRLTNGLYYVVTDTNGAEQGAVIQAYKTNGRLSYKLVELHSAPKPQTELEPYISNYVTHSNVTVDYTKTTKFQTVSDYVDYLDSVLANVQGEEPNDAAKRELAQYIQNAVTELSTGKVRAWGNKLTIDAGDVKELTAKARDAKAVLFSAAEKDGVSLNKQLDVVIRTVGKLDTDKPMELTLDGSLADSLDGASLQVVLGDGSHSLRVSGANLKTLLGQYGSLTVQIDKAGDGQYAVSFLDGDGKTLPRIASPVTLTLPADSEFSTVLVTYAGGSDNWGGQYDAANHAISFETSYSGTYQIIENAKNITDISGLSAEEQNAVRFMVSKGYFSLDESGAFRPDALLTRYDFTSALVGMFFALDRELKTSFPDVPQNSIYYAQVASAQAGKIVMGFDDGTFGGDKNITAEQVLSLAARTLVDKKGYAYPGNPADYLIFPGADSVSQWAQQAAALAAREGIAAPNEAVSPTEAISRSKAALYLYRLFMLLYEVSPVETGAAGGLSMTPTMAAACAAVLLGAALALALLGGRSSGRPPRRRRLRREMSRLKTARRLRRR